MAAMATFALKAGVWFRRGRLFMVSPDSQAPACPLSGRNSTYRPVQNSGTTSFVGLDERRQIQQFVTINDEAKGVPKSLLLNLLKQIPDKTLQEQANERAIDLAKQLNNNQQSVFFQHIASISAPRTGQISDINFVRKVAPLVHPEKGLLPDLSTKRSSQDNRELLQCAARYFS
jgi:hypothetical protein